jgi:hypothetical protein
MNVLHEIAPFLAFAAPVVTLIAINLALLWAGEEDTLLLPGVRAYPAVEHEAVEAEASVAAEPAQAAESPDELRLAA